MTQTKGMHPTTINTVSYGGCLKVFNENLYCSSVIFCSFLLSVPFLCTLIFVFFVLLRCRYDCFFVSLPLKIKWLLHYESNRMHLPPNLIQLKFECTKLNGIYFPLVCSFQISFVKFDKRFENIPCQKFAKIQFVKTMRKVWKSSAPQKLFKYKKLIQEI